MMNMLIGEYGREFVCLGLLWAFFERENHKFDKFTSETSDLTEIPLFTGC